jgi:hypothetical protein
LTDDHFDLSNFRVQPVAMPQATFMSDEGNRAWVVENAMDQTFQEFMSHRREYMTLEQIAEMDWTVF